MHLLSFFYINLFLLYSFGLSNIVSRLLFNFSINYSNKSYKEYNTTATMQTHSKLDYFTEMIFTHLFFFLAITFINKNPAKGLGPEQDSIPPTCGYAM